MKFCINYFEQFKYTDEIEEMTIKFCGSEEQKSRLRGFMKLYPGLKRINLKVEDIGLTFYQNRTDLFLKDLEEEYKDRIAILIVGSEDKDELGEFFKTIGVKYFFSEAAATREELNYYASLGVSDVYITGQLGFELTLISTGLERLGIRLRAIVNVVQKQCKTTANLLGFFIRPEDLDLYYNAGLDVAEFYTDDLMKQNTLYEIYAIDKRWEGDLALVINGFEPEEVSNDYVVNIFGQRRVNCGRRCLAGNYCEICPSILHLADTLKDNGYRLIYEN